MSGRGWGKRGREREREEGGREGEDRRERGESGRRILKQTRYSCLRNIT